MDSGSKIVSANVSTEPFCELTASSYALLGGCSIAADSFQNAMPGGRSLVYLREEDVPVHPRTGVNLVDSI